MNYKIEVGSEVESKEVQELLFELGYKWFSGGNQVQHLKQSCSSSFGYLVAWSSGCFTNVIQCGCGDEDAKEITIPQLKDIVVLKRNDISDATHTDQDNWKWFIGSDGVGYVWQCGNADNLKQWDQSSLDMVDLKPLKKEVVMKEYLNKLEDGTYKLVVLDSVADGVEGLIEVPDGADKAFQAFSNAPVVFKRSECGYSNAVIIWQRETLNDKVASAEAARQSGVFVGTPFSDLPAFNFGAIDDFVESNVEQTLIDRESTYGSFKDVADTTSKLMGVLLNSKNGQMLPCTHQEALHMICSKMARIVNGDYDYKDNWHDIGGYAKLIENLIDGV